METVQEHSAERQSGDDAIDDTTPVPSISSHTPPPPEQCFPAPSPATTPLRLEPTANNRIPPPGEQSKADNANPLLTGDDIPSSPKNLFPSNLSPDVDEGESLNPGVSTSVILKASISPLDPARAENPIEGMQSDSLLSGKYLLYYI
jgi:hypothetical protein